MSGNLPTPNRRAFLQTTAIGCAAIATRRVQATDKPLAGKIRKAVKFQMVAEELSVVDKFRLLKDLGFDGTEVLAHGKTAASQISKAIESTGLPVHGVINGLNPDLRAAIDLAKHFGSDSVLVIAGENSKRTYNDNFRDAQQLIRSVISHAEKLEIRLLIENVRATFLKTAEEMARFVDSFDTPIVGAYFDTGNTITWTKQTAEHWAGVLGQRIVKLDIKDRGHDEFGDVKRQSTVAVGTDGGEVHWANVRKELVHVNFSGWATAEVRGGDRQRLAGISAWMDQVLNQ